MLPELLLVAVAVDPVDAVGPHVPFLEQGVFHIIYRVTVSRAYGPVAGDEHEYDNGS